MIGPGVIGLVVLVLDKAPTLAQGAITGIGLILAARVITVLRHTWAEIALWVICNGFRLIKSTVGHISIKEPTIRIEDAATDMQIADLLGQG